MVNLTHQLKLAPGESLSLPSASYQTELKTIVYRPTV